MKSGGWKLLDLLNRTSGFFMSKGMENARLQAELLLAAVLGVRRLDLYLQFERALDKAEVDAYRDSVRQRLQGVPVQYITGEAGFRHLNFALSRSVFIPRPETETVVEAVLELVVRLAEPRILDLGCGCGAIAVSLAHECRMAHLVAVDISPEAVETTRRNAERNGVSGRLDILCGDLFEALKGMPESQTFDVIASNPPYVCSGDIVGLLPEVRDHEPRLALDGGSDGLQYYRRIVEQAADFLRPGGFMVLEVGDGQAEAVGELLGSSSLFETVETRADLNHTPRVLVGRSAGAISRVGSNG